MQTARQPTIRTWLLFVVLFVFPFTLLRPHFADRFEPREQLIFAALEMMPLALALLVGLVCRRFWMIPAVCVLVRCGWYFLALMMVVFDRPAHLHAVIFPLWPEFALCDWLKPDFFELIMFFMFCSAGYAMVGILLALTCQLRDPIAAETEFAI